MTATPIPRTLALTAYGDLDVSVIHELPPGRQPVRTLVQPDPARRRLPAGARRRSSRGARPMSSIRWSRSREKIDLKAATEMAEHLAAEVFPESARRAAARPDEGRREGRGDARASSPATSTSWSARPSIEVGVDVPNATVMVVEHAERFGLSQLHQLRGRVGRGAHASSCVLLYQSPWTRRGERAAVGDGRDRPTASCIAERDLALRGPGDFFGTRQSGVPLLRAGDPCATPTCSSRRTPRPATLVEAGAVPAAPGAHVAARLAATVRPVLVGWIGIGAGRIDRAHHRRRRSRAARWPRRPGTGCGRPPTRCARRCSTCSAPRCPARSCWICAPAPGPSASRRSAAAPSASPSSTAIRAPCG